MYRTALKMLMVMTLLTGLIYPLVITWIANMTMLQKAGGSLLYVNNKAIGSKLIAQNFEGAAYFWPRPSAVDFDPIKSGGSNLGPTSKKLKEIVEKRGNRLGSNPPMELLYASGSGLDPHISLGTAYFQFDRIAKARSIANLNHLQTLVDSLGEGFEKKYVNVLILNQSLDKLFPLK